MHRPHGTDTAMNECLGQRLLQVDAHPLMPHDVLLSPQSYKSGRTVDDFRKLLRRDLKLDREE